MCVYCSYLIHRILINDHNTWSQHSPEVGDTTEVATIPPSALGYNHKHHDAI